MSHTTRACIAVAVSGAALTLGIVVAPHAAQLAGHAAALLSGSVGVALAVAARARRPRYWPTLALVAGMLIVTVAALHGVELLFGGLLPAGD